MCVMFRLRNNKFIERGFKMLISKRFLMYRAKNNLSQQELADRLKVARELVNRIENGKLKASKMVLIKMDLLEKGE